MAGDRACIGASNDEEVLVAACGEGGADLRCILLARDDLLAVEMSAFLRELLILDVDCGNLMALELSNRRNTLSFDRL